MVHSYTPGWDRGDHVEIGVKDKVRGYWSNLMSFAAASATLPNPTRELYLNYYRIEHFKKFCWCHALKGLENNLGESY